MAFEFDPESYDPGGGFAPLSEGPHRVRIEGHAQKVSRSGNDMVELLLSVSGERGRLWFYVVDGVYANKNIGDILYSCGLLEQAKANGFDWKMLDGKVGAVQVKHETYNGKPSAKVHYWLAYDEVEGLPPWQDPERQQPPNTADAPMPTFPDDAPAKKDDDNIPF